MIIFRYRENTYDSYDVCRSKLLEELRGLACGYVYRNAMEITGIRSGKNM